MAAPLRRLGHMNALRRSNHLPLPAVSLTIPLHSPASPRSFTQSTYDWFFSPAPPDPTIWNQAICTAEWYFSTLHDLTGVSWGWSVILGTFLLRSVVTFPLLVLGEVNQDRLAKLQFDIVADGVKLKLMKQIEELARHAPGLLKTKEAKEALLNAERKKLMQREYGKRNCHPLKNLALPLVQIPLWFSASIALRNMSGSYVVEGAQIVPTCPDMLGEAFLWIPDLCAADSTGALSVLLGLTYLTLVEINIYKQFNGEPLKRRARIVTNLLRGVSVVVMPTFAFIVPTTVSLYWLTSAFVGLTHNVIVMSPALRRSIGITLRASPDDAPAGTIWAGFRGYWKL